MKRLLVILMLNPVLGMSQQGDSTLLQLIKGYEQELADAVAVGDTNVWKKYVHENCMITTEDGSVLSRKQLVSELRPLPEGYVGKIIIIEPKLVRYGNTAVFSFIDDEYLELFNLKIHTQYKQTDTWINFNGQWRKIAMQLFEIPKNPPPVSVDSAILKRHTGNYILGPEMTSSVYVENGKLFVRKMNRQPTELLAQTENVFFREGDGRVDVIFLPDRMIERREGEDLVWKRQ
jgi:hypothetical protein